MPNRYVLLRFDPETDLHDVREGFEAAGLDLGDVTPRFTDEGEFQAHMTLEDADALLAATPSMKSYFNYVGDGGTGSPLSVPSLQKPKLPKSVGGAPNDDGKNESVKLIVAESLMRRLSESAVGVIPDDAAMQKVGSEFHLTGVTRQQAEAAYSKLGSPAGVSIVSA